ncbi:membrane protease YdiL (CAAX protease family) [Sporosarcina luteola]|nr:membrane protease YdiL (CAAX protease family) [Sporosarcina luteola]
MESKHIVHSVNKEGKDITRYSIMTLFALTAMTVISLSSIWGMKIAGISIGIGIVFYINNRTTTRSIVLVKETDRKVLKHLIWVILPFVMNGICFLLAYLFVPDFIQHIQGRTEVVLSISHLLLFVFQLAILAVGEEIAWRGFFQKQLGKSLPVIPAITLTSIVFTLGHFVFGPLLVVSYDLVFIFINSVLYGIVYYRTDSFWISAISHFLANLFAVVLLLFLG